MTMKRLFLSVCPSEQFCSFINRPVPGNKFGNEELKARMESREKAYLLLLAQLVHLMAHVRFIFCKSLGKVQVKK